MRQKGAQKRKSSFGQKKKRSKTTKGGTRKREKEEGADGGKIKITGTIWGEIHCRRRKNYPFSSSGEKGRIPGLRRLRPRDELRGGAWTSRGEGSRLLMRDAEAAL